LRRVILGKAQDSAFCGDMQVYKISLALQIIGPDPFKKQLRKLFLHLAVLSQDKYYGTGKDN